MVIQMCALISVLQKSYVTAQPEALAYFFFSMLLEWILPVEYQWLLSLRVY